MEQRLKRFRTLLLKFPKIAIDTPCLLYHVEKNPKYINFTEVIFEDLLPNNKISAVASTLLLTETLARPFAENRQDLVYAYKSIIKGFPNLILYPLSEELAEKAGYLRGAYRLGTPDAIHIATAIETNSQAIIGNDLKWKKIKEIKCILLDEFV